MVSYLTILPTLLAILIVIDLIYMTISVIVYPLLILFSFSTKGKFLLERYEKM